jgi:hypothetical protein
MLPKNVAALIGWYQNCPPTRNPETEPHTVESGFDSRQGKEILLHSIQTGSGAHLASYPKGTGGGSLPGVKRPGREADLLSSCSNEVKIAWFCTSTPYVFMAQYLAKQRYSFL